MPRMIDPELVRANERRAREVLEETVFTRDLGIELISLSPGEASARLPDSPRNHNTNGVAHGGVLYSLADTIASLAAASWGEGGVTVQGNISYLLPASGDLLRLACHLYRGQHHGQPGTVRMPRRFSSYADTRAASVRSSVRIPGYVRNHIIILFPGLVQHSMRHALTGVPLLDYLVSSPRASLASTVTLRLYPAKAKSTVFRSGAGVTRLTNGTITSPASMAKAPQLMGDWSSAGKAERANRFSTIMPAPKTKLTQTDARLVRFMYRP